MKYAAGYTITEAAESLGVTRMTIYRWMKEKRFEPIRLLTRILIPKLFVDEYPVKPK